ncbi:hypothetical protein DL93DRAFT_1751376 [Clavulina sp. PMI_390]|nr:hypothetical protein DL93DRAFT_1751376 [Clavulina sp. PMI_390]
MAFVHRLPTELLAHIFLSLIEDFRSWEDYSDLHRHRSLLCVVCSRWRSIALSIPTLWATISIGGATAFEQENSETLDLLKLLLKRPRNNTLLSVRFMQCPQPLLEGLWATLNPHFSRVRKMTIIADRNVYSDLLPMPSAPQLRSLKYVDTMLYEDEFELVRHMNDAPLLCYLDVENISWKALSNIPLRQLTALRLSRPRTWRHIPVIQWAEVFSILHQCVSLEFLHADLLGSGLELLPQEIIDLPTLRGLTISRPELTSHLRTPKLEFIHGLKLGAACDPQQSLPHLKLYVAEDGDENLKRWRMPGSFATVERLHFKNCYRSILVHVFHMLVEKNSVDAVPLASLPHLRILTLSRLRGNRELARVIIPLVLKMLDFTPNLRVECVWDEFFPNGPTEEQQEKYGHRIIPLKSFYGEMRPYEELF